MRPPFSGRWGWRRRPGPSGASRRRSIGTESDRERTRKTAGDAAGGPAPVLLGILSVVALFPVLVEYGGSRLSPGMLVAVRLANFAFVGVFAFVHVLEAIYGQDRRRFLRSAALDLSLLLLLGLTFLLVAIHPFGFFEVPGIMGFVIPAQIYLFLNFFLKVLQLFKVAGSRRIHYARAFGVSFVVIIATGTLLLYLLPGTKAPGRELGFVDAVFTATSATCVTGLVTVDTGTQFSRFGQTIILVLFQVGALGLMTFAAFFVLALGKGMGLRDRQVMKGVLNLDVLGKIARVIVGILVITVVIEALGALALYWRWQGSQVAHDRLFTSIFHSVSAFCNAGFSLQKTSLMEYRGDLVVNLIVMAQIVLGGLGFAVLLEILGLPILGIRRRHGHGGAAPEDRRIRRRLTVQTRIVLVTSAVLILLGAALIYALEAGNPATLGGLPRGERVQAAFFQSITSRTAGFNTVPIGEMTDAGKFLLIMLMFVGASPGSTGGGIKTVTAVILIFTVIALLRGRDRVEIGRRTIPRETVSRAVVIVVAAIGIVMTATLVLTAVEGGRFPFLSVFFEVGSAFGTVGLSTGITGALSSVSKLTLCVVMLIGRIGPLSLVIALSQARARRRYEYPEEHVMIG